MKYLYVRMQSRRVLAVLLVGLLPLAATSNCLAQQDPAQSDRSTKTEFDVAIQLESFDFVWQSIKDSHWDPEVVGKRWDASRDELRPKIESARSIDEVRKVLSDLLERLGQSHFGIIPTESYKIIEERERSGGDGFSGLLVRQVEDRLMVVSVRPDSPAEQAGIKTGWLVEKIDDKTAEQIFERTRKAAEHSPARSETMVALTVDGLTTGKIGSSIKLELLDRDDKPQSVEMQLVKGPGRRAKLGHLPTFTVEYQSRLLSDDIGYLTFNAFLDSQHLIAQYTQSLEDFRQTNGLIIDLRGNRGGLVILVMGMCGWFVDDRQSLGAMVMRGNPLQLSLNPRSPKFDLPVAVLIDECSISAAEIMSGGLKDLGLARVFGSRSAGLVLPSVVTKLPNGDGFQYALADYSSASGKVLEGTGVAPDVPISLTRSDLLSDRDPVLEQAKKWILNQGQIEK